MVSFEKKQIILTWVHQHCYISLGTGIEIHRDAHKRIIYIPAERGDSSQACYNISIFVTFSNDSIKIIIHETIRFTPHSFMAIQIGLSVGKKVKVHGTPMCGFGN
jgi:hypothetical protein